MEWQTARDNCPVRARSLCEISDAAVPVASLRFGIGADRPDLETALRRVAACTYHDVGSFDILRRKAEEAGYDLEAGTEPQHIMDVLERADAEARALDARDRAEGFAGPARVGWGVAGRGRSAGYGRSWMWTDGSTIFVGYRADEVLTVDEGISCALARTKSEIDINRERVKRSHRTVARYLRRRATFHSGRADRAEEAMATE